MGINTLDLFKILISNNIDFYTGVPDSLLKEFCFCIDDNVSENTHIIAPNEGNAVALAAGYHLGTGKLPLVYMQNSGIGNAINPLLSLCDPEVYSIPMIIFIGWRGEPGVKDEPQHIKQGKIQLDLIKSMDIAFSVISKDEQNINKKINEGISLAIDEQRPFIFLIKKGTFDKYKSKGSINKNSLIKNDFMTREKALEIIIKEIPKDSVIISTTGKTSREIFEIRENFKMPHYKDFLTVGSMGHCSSIALGIALSNPKRKIICIDGDGSMIMHMGSLSMIGDISPSNFFHILINNYVHESVGGQKTAAKLINIQKLVESNSYKNTLKVEDVEGLKYQLNQSLLKKGPNFLEIITKPGSREDLGRPTIKPHENKKHFMGFLKQNKD